MAIHLRAVAAASAGTDPASPAVGKHDAYVIAQLQGAERRIRLLDVSAALLGFVAVACVFVGVAVLGDYFFASFATIRPFVLFGFLCAAVAYLGVTLARPLFRTINPYYTAIQMERTAPGAKNSVINWLDLHEAHLPPAIRNSLGQRAKKDLERADVEKAFSGRRTTWLGVLAGAGFGFLIAQFIWIGPSDFFFHVQRSFTPFGETTRTTLTVVQPKGGDATVTTGKSVTIAVAVSGKIPNPGSPEALTLYYRYDDQKGYERKWLQQDAAGDWTANFSAYDVRDGFFYKVTGGDAETPEYRISVDAPPMIREVVSTYHWRPYVANPDEGHRSVKPAKLEALCGTEVTLQVRTNRALKDAYLEFENKEGAERLAATLLPNDPKSFVVQFVVEKSTNYRLHFTSTENEASVDDVVQPIVAVRDAPPNPVELIAPGKDVELPANGLLQLEGGARDDVGVKSLTLQMKVVNGPALAGQKYRSDEAIALPGGGYPRNLDYKDFVDLAKVQTVDGMAFPLAAGMELEYWLEARDACDYPKPDVNVSESKHYKVKILPPETDEQKRKQEREQAENAQQQHDKKQNDELKKEADKRAQEKQDKANENDANREKTDNKQGDNKPGENGNSDKRSEEQEKKDKEALEKLKEIQDKLNSKPNEKSAPKDDPKKSPSESKGDGHQNQPQPGDAKPEPKPDQQKDSGQEKGPGKQPQPNEKPEPSSADKPDSGSNPMEQKAAPKNDDAKQPNDAKSDAKSDAKDKGQPKPQPKPAEPKEGGSPEQQHQAAEDKPDKADPKQQESKGVCKKDGPSEGNSDKQPAAANKEKPPESDKSQGKADGDASTGTDPKAKPKDGAQTAQGDKSPEGANKPDGAKPENRDVARSNAKGDDKKSDKANGSSGDPRDAKPKDVEDLARKLSDANPEKRQDAADKLDEIKKQARDDKAREDAAKALEKSDTKPRPEPQIAEKKDPPKEGNTATAKNEPKESGTGEGKPDKPAQQGVAKGDSKDRKDPDSKNPMNPENKGGGEQIAQNKEKQSDQRAPGNNDPRNQNNARNPASEQEPPPLNEKAVGNKASTLQLEDIRKKLDKDMLKELNWTEADKDKFLKDLADAMKRQGDTKETLPGAQNSSVLPSMRGKITSGGTTDNNTSGKALPPPEYRNPFADFLKDLNQAEKKDK